jgi:zinc transporter, ZIP family
MSSGEIVLLGAVAGFTIFLGLPVGRVRAMPVMYRALLNAGAAGVLVFLLVETTANAFDPIRAAVSGNRWSDAAVRTPIFLAAFAIGLLGLVYYEKRLMRRRVPAPAGPGAALLDDLQVGGGGVAGLSDTRRLALFIAIGIGLHNLAEGLAIGQSAASGRISLALLLVVGFGLHNSTEGFGIVAPLAAEADRPSWGFLAALGLIGGGPTFVGTLIGQSVTNTNLEIAFLALAAGSILYVVVQLLTVAFRLEHDTRYVMWGLFAGMVLGFLTDLVLVAAGA